MAFALQDSLWLLRLLLQPLSLLAQGKEGKRKGTPKAWSPLRSDCPAILGCTNEDPNKPTPSGVTQNPVDAAERFQKNHPAMPPRKGVSTLFS